MGRDVLGVWQSIINDNLSHTEEYIRVSYNSICTCTGTYGVQDAASETFGVLCQSHYCGDVTVVTRVQGENAKEFNCLSLSHPLRRTDSTIFK